MPSSFDYSNSELRTEIINQIKLDENIKRKQVSLAQFEIMKDRILESVTQYLKGFYSEETIQEMPIFGCINLAKRIIENEAAIYRHAPERKFTGVTDDQAAILAQVYKDMNANTRFMKANKYYKLQEQTHLNIVTSMGQLKLRALLSHHLDIVPSPEDTETGDAFILNGFDKSLYAPRLVGSDGIDSKIADADDYKQSLKRLALWSDDQNFIMDEKGKIVSGDDLSNPIGIAPFVDISDDKDNEYWVRSGTATTDFTIQWNASISDLAHIVRMQGFAQAWFKGAENMIPEKIQIGPSFVIKLPINPNAPVDTDFGFANPSPDLSGSIQFVEMILSAFLSSRGIDPKLINTKGESSKTFASGLERLLAMIDMFAPAKTDFDLFMSAEQRVFNIVKAYLNTYQGTDVLKYRIGQLSDEAQVEVKFHEPEMIQSESDKLANIEKKREMGLMSRTQALMDLYGVSKEAAMEIAKSIDDEDVEAMKAAEERRKKAGNNPPPQNEEDEE